MAKGNIIYFENKIDNRIYVIRSGKVELKREWGCFLVDNALRETMILREGDVFGFEELFQKIPRDHRATAIEDVELLYFDFEEFSNVLKTNAKIGEKILNSLAGRIRGMNNCIMDMCILGNLPSSESSGSMIDIYQYFININDLKRALQVLERMKNDEKYKEFAEKEIKTRFVKI